MRARLIVLHAHNVGGYITLSVAEAEALAPVRITVTVTE
jgi:hypothetical protein